MRSQCAAGGAAASVRSPRRLEAERGAPPFDRAFRPPRLTPLGREVAQAARSLCARVTHRDSHIRAQLETFLALFGDD